MAFSKLLLLLVLMPVIASADDIFFFFLIIADDILTPFYDAICDNIQCGKGTCVGNISYPLGYKCECETGWARTTNDSFFEFHTFLPCVIPQCTLNYNSSCQAAPSLPQDKPIPSNISAFDPCYWIYCGGGTCSRNSTYNHVCNCSSGYSNLLDTPYYPCYSQCALGSDCASLGIKVSNSESNGTTGSSDTGAGNEILPGKLHWMIILLATVLIALHK